jgi:DNA-binding response OmpR family regulator
MIRKILLVDDDPVQHQLIQATLEGQFQIFHVTNLREARTMLPKMRFDLVIVDARLPDGLGSELCQSIKATPFIFISANEEARGTEDYLVKPFSPLELEARIHAKLTKRRAA